MEPKHEKYLAHEITMQKFRWATPAGLAILTIIMAVTGWVATDYLTQIRNSINELKVDGNDHYDKLWAVISKSNARVDCLQNQLAKCCKDSVYCS